MTKEEQFEKEFGFSTNDPFFQGMLRGARRFGGNEDTVMQFCRDFDSLPEQVRRQLIAKMFNDLKNL